MVTVPDESDTELTRGSPPTAYTVVAVRAGAAPYAGVVTELTRPRVSYAVHTHAEGTDCPSRWPEATTRPAAPPGSAEPAGWGISVSRPGEIQMSVIKPPHQEYRRRLGLKGRCEAKHSPHQI